MKEFFSLAFLYIGIAFIFIGSLGIVRLPDALCRAHAMSKALTLGISLMLIGLWIDLGTVRAGLKIILAIVFLFFTIPLAGHIFGLYAVKGPKE